MERMKNVPLVPTKLSDLIEVKDHRVVSMFMSKVSGISMYVMAFAEGESVSEEAYEGDTLYIVMEGTMIIVKEDESFEVPEGSCMAVPAGQLHALEGPGAFKILQITF